MGPIELAILGVLDALGAGPAGPTVQSERVLEQVDAKYGIAPQFSYETIVRAVDPTLTHVRVLRGLGNMGSRDFPPAHARYTEVRMSAVGAHVLQANRSGDVDLPIGLINGNVHLYGARPAFDPFRVLDALDLVATSPNTSDGEVARAVGPPVFPAGCDIECDAEALAEGSPVELTMRSGLSRTTDQNDRPAILVTGLPPNVALTDVLSALRGLAYSQQMVERHPRLADRLLPIADINDLSARGVERIMISLAADTDLDLVERRLMEVWGIATRVRRSVLPEPMANAVRRHASGDADEVTGATAAFRRLLADDSSG